MRGKSRPPKSAASESEAFQAAQSPSGALAQRPRAQDSQPTPLGGQSGLRKPIPSPARRPGASHLVPTGSAHTEPALSGRLATTGEGRSFREAGLSSPVARGATLDALQLSDVASHPRFRTKLSRDQLSCTTTTRTAARWR